MLGVPVDLTVNVPTLVSIALALIGAIVWLVRLQAIARQTAREKAQLEKSLGATVGDVEKRLDALVGLQQLHREQAQEHRLQMAEKFVTPETVAEIKHDLVQ